jgi:hypothetical protein
MPYFIDEYADQLNRMLHTVLSPTWCYKQEIVIVPGLITAIFIQSGSTAVIRFTNSSHDA